MPVIDERPSMRRPECTCGQSGIHFRDNRSCAANQPPAPTLTDFLLARIAEDEAAVKADLVGRDYPNPARALATCKAHRRFVQEAEDQVSAYFSRFILETLAAVYSDHPDYRDEWRP